MKLCNELMPVLHQLQSQGATVYTYTPIDDREYHSLFWLENGRVLNIQPNTRRHYKFARDRFDLGVSYVPSIENGSGCGLTQDRYDTGTPAAELLSFRNRPTWVHGVQNYKSMAALIKDHRPLEFFELDANGEKKE